MASFFEWFFLFLIVIIIGILGYMLYIIFPSEPVSLKIVNNLANNGQSSNIIDGNLSSSEQFYENMRFRSSDISYKIEASCDEEKRDNVQRALLELESNTPLDFFPVDRNPELSVFCSEIPPESGNKDYFIAGEGGPTEVINASLYSVILSAKVSFFRDEKCDEPRIATHEILHALGFDHNDNPNSILYPTLDCDQEVDSSIITEINRLYSTKSAPDLKISEIQATKAGSYLNFEIGVVNQGLQEAENAILSVYDGDRMVKKFSLDDISIGTTKILNVENLRISRGSEEVTFYIDENNVVDEIFENNNEARLVLE